MDFIIFDLEATCWPGNMGSRVQEIIEIGAIKCDGFGHPVSDFQSFVRPKLYPDLSPYCLKLTGIEQSDIDTASGFETVANAFRTWCEYSDDGYLLCSWGDKDAELLQNDCELHGLDTDWLDDYIDLKRQYHEIFGIEKRNGLVKTLKRENIAFEGSHHRAMDDAQNLFMLFGKHLDVWQY